jgi:hypothetical protein
MTFDEFLAIVAIGKAKETARVYGVHLSAWKTFADEKGINPLAPTPHDITDYLQTIPNEKTRASVRSILLTAFTHLAIATRDDGDIERLEAIKYSC